VSCDPTPFQRSGPDPEIAPLQVTFAPVLPANRFPPPSETSCEYSPPAVTLSVVDDAIVRAAAPPRLLSAEMLKPPPWRLMPPVNVLLPLRVSVPVPVLMRLPFPESDESIVVLELSVPIVRLAPPLSATVPGPETVLNT